MFKGNYHKTRHLAGMAVVHMRTKDVVVDTTPKHAMSEAEFNQAILDSITLDLLKGEEDEADSSD